MIQFRYCGSSDENKNYLNNITIQKLVNENILASAASKIRIAGIPGTKFYLNQSFDDQSALYLGFDGIFDLDVDKVTAIDYLRFDASLNELMSKETNTVLIIEIEYAQ